MCLTDRRVEFTDVISSDDLVLETTKFNFQAKADGDSEQHPDGGGQC